ncbi:MAG: hypothetical protein PHI58_07035 [Candidatus Omnitrophica bacterium]|nr:hypothetical protein [Candidatus Omnitrophota bacterium]
MKYNLVTVVWGAEYTDLFVNVVMPSILTPGNLYALDKNPRSLYRIFTTEEDSEKITASDAFKKISGMMDTDVVMIENKDFTEKYTVMSECHKKAIRSAGLDSAAIIFVAPDAIFSEGAISRMVSLAESGKRAVMIAGIRVSKDTFLPEFTRQFSADGVMMPATARQLTKLSMAHLHPISKSLMWDSGEFHNAPSHIYFEVPGEGLIARCFHLLPVLVNPARTNLRFETIDGNYIRGACPNPDDMYIVSDSDELMSIEMSSLSMKPDAGRAGANAFKIAVFAKYAADPYNRIFARQKIRLHSGDISPKWAVVEEYSDRSIDKVFYWLKFEPFLFSPRRILWKAKTAGKNVFRFFEKLLKRAEVNRTVFFGVMARVWAIMAGPVTALLIAVKFTPDLQGYYYTFWNLLALQAFAELGLGTVITQFASHEWSKLKMDAAGRLSGDEGALSRLVSLARIMFRWYFCAGFILAAGLMAGGYLFFSRSAQTGVEWSSPWFVLCMLVGINLFLIPVWALLEGCNQVLNVYAYRFFQGLFTSVSVWLAIFLGAGLWTVSVSILATIIGAMIFLRLKYRGFLKSVLFSRVSGSKMNWRGEIFPMQWRMALSSVSGYFVFSLFTPTLFKFHGPVVAGQMGMTWSVVGFMATIPGAWIVPKAPYFGMLIARKDYAELDTVFGRLMKVFLVNTVILAVSIWFFVYILNVLKLPIAGRLISPMPTAIFLLAQVLMMSSVPLSVYLRAHKKEPLLFVSILTGILVGTFTIVLGKLYSVTGIAAGYLLATSIVVPIVAMTWVRCRAEWHSEKV